MIGRRASALCWASTLLMAAAAAVFLVLGPGRPVPSDLFGGVAGAAFLVLALTYGTVGAVIALRLPGHRIGWLFLLIGWLCALNVLTYAYAEYGIYAARLPLTDAAAAVWSSLEVIAPLLVLSVLLLPDGRLPSRRWWPAMALLIVACALLPLSRMLMPGPMQDPFGPHTNPFGVAGARELMTTLDGVGWALTYAALVLGVLAVRVRLRRSEGVERQQVKWVLAVTTAVGLAAALVMSTWYFWPDARLQARMALLGLVFAGVPVAAGVAILRYRLYDLDIVINGALVYGALTVLLAITYAAVTLLLGTALGSGSAPATAAATLAVAIAFRPLRARLQDAVDRRFNRARYEALRRVASFLDEVRAGRAPPEEVEDVLRGVLDDARLELRLLLPESGQHVDVRGAPVVEDTRDRRARTPIERAGTPIGEVLSSRARPDLLRRVVEAAGLAIEIVRLRAELRRHLDEVAASRRRIVAAGDEERRRIERDLHDGAQQRLVSIGLAMRHAQHEAGAGSRAAQTLESALGEIAVAIRELRELARGLRPSQLDAGLGPALEELADRVPLTVTVEATRERFPAGIETAAYFIASEGLTNAAKHAQASHVSLSAARRNGSLVLCVADDGVGGASPAGGSGLSGLADRVGAHGGTLRIESERGSGTRLTVELPCES